MFIGHKVRLHGVRIILTAFFSGFLICPIVTKDSFEINFSPPEPRLYFIISDSGFWVGVSVASFPFALLPIWIND